MKQLIRRHREERKAQRGSLRLRSSSSGVIARSAKRDAAVSGREGPRKNEIAAARCAGLAMTPRLDGAATLMVARCPFDALALT